MTSKQNLEWRIPAKIIAIIDLIFIVVVSPLPLLESLISKDADRLDGVQVEGWTYWSDVAIWYVQIGVGLWAAVQLIKATELGRESIDAYKRSQSWQIVWIVFIVIDVVQSCIADEYVLMFVGVLIRVIFMYIVFRFMQEVQASEFITTPHQIIQKV